MSYLNFDLYEKIDAVGGTSIGGILALAYSLSNDYANINKIFKKNGPKIFSKKNLLYPIKGIKYDNKNLKNLLHEMFSDKKLSDIEKIKIIIAATDFTLTQPRIFENINLTSDIELEKIGLCTSAAPTYFNAQELKWNNINDKDIKNIPLNERIIMLSSFEKDRLIKDPNFKKASTIFDGGMLENIPIISTYTTLHNELGVEPKDIDMFVIGAGNFLDEQSYTAKQVNKWSLLKILNKLIVPYVTDSNEQTSVFWGLQMGFNSFHYFNPINISGQMDDPKILDKIEIECEKYKNEFINDINEFLNK